METPTLEQVERIRNLPPAETDLDALNRLTLQMFWLRDIVQGEQSRTENFNQVNEGK